MYDARRATQTIADQCAIDTIKALPTIEPWESVWRHTVIDIWPVDDSGRDIHRQLAEIGYELYRQYNRSSGW